MFTASMHMYLTASRFDYPHTINSLVTPRYRYRIRERERETREKEICVEEKEGGAYTWVL